VLLINLNKAMINQPKITKYANSGFSIVEVLIVVALSSLMLAISIPNFMTFVYRQRLSMANREIYQALREAQGQAIRRKEVWQATIREKNDVVMWAVHHTTDPLNTVQWHQIDKNIDLDWTKTDIYSKTFDGNLKEYVWRVRFNDDGHFVEVGTGQMAGGFNPRITLKLSPNVESASFAKGCVSVETIVGAMRVEKDDKCK
jgi:prepilin-type N-terminal cleavage/methylation domain-containing protein